MKENNKYYTPDISEFHVGFEYECLDLSDDFESKTWRKQIFEGEDLRGYFTEEIKKGEIRVKHLDREDIESFGFEVKSDYGVGTSYHLHNSYRLDTVKREGITYSEFEVRIFKIGILDCLDRIFIGDIKNKSELKRILVQTNILQTKP